MHETFGGGEPESAVAGAACRRLRLASTFAAAHAVALAKQNGIEDVFLSVGRPEHLFAWNFQQSAGRAEPEDAISVVEHGEDGIFDQALRRSDMDGHRAAEKVHAARFRADPDISGVISGDGQNEWIRKTVFLADRFQAGILYAIETIERAND